MRRAVGSIAPAARIVTTTLVVAAIVMGAVAGANARQATPSTSPMPSCDGALPHGRMVYLTGGDDQEGAIVVAEADGTELDHFPIEGDGIVRATGYEGRALVQTFGDTDATTMYLVDVTSVNVTPIDLPATIDGELLLFLPGAVGNASKRWVVVSELSGDQAVLIDMQTGTAADLSPLVAGEEVSWGAVTADDQFVAILADDQLRIAPVGRLDQSRAVGGAPITYVSLAPDGGSLLYSIGGDGLRRLVREDVASGETIVVASSLVPPLSGTFLESGDRIVVQRGPIVSVIDLATGDERIVRRNVPPVVFAWPLESGSRLVVRFAADGGGTWALVDPEAGEVHRYDTAWSRGEAVLLSTWSADGRYAFFIEQTDEQSSLWLVEAGASTADEVASGNYAVGSFSPDGCWMALTTTEERGDEVAVRTEIVPIGGEEPTVTFDGYAITWIEA